MLPHGYITKSLFVEYNKNPKLARWKYNDSHKFKEIRKIDEEEQQNWIIRMGEIMEEKVREYLESTHSCVAVECFDTSLWNRDTDEGTTDVTPRSVMNYDESLRDNMDRTLQAINDGEKILFQPGFLHGSCFVRGDFMVRNDDGSYDLIEVKSKSNVRKKVSHEKINYHVGEIEKEFIDDCSFQKYVINAVLAEKGLDPINVIKLVSLNNKYVLNGTLNLSLLLDWDDLETTSQVLLTGEKKDRTVERVDNLHESAGVEYIIAKINDEIALDEDVFNQIHRFPGNKYLDYFGEKAKFGTVMAIPSLHFSKAPFVQDYYYEGKHALEDFSKEELGVFANKQGEGTAMTFFDNYFGSKEGPIIDHSAIQEMLGELQYPICFYDYESVCVPLPFMDGVRPYQHSVVQYSLHKYYEDGSMKHYGGLLTGLGESNVDTITIGNNPNDIGDESEKSITGSWFDLAKEFVADIGDDIDRGTFVMRYQAFENPRNREIAEMASFAPEIANAFKKMQEPGRYFDLMDIFKKSHYFDRKFLGSASIKNVLPVIVPEMDYNWLNVSNGGIAMRKLYDLVIGNIPTEEREELIKDLLLYCGQDSLAMVRIFERLRDLES